MAKSYVYAQTQTKENYKSDTSITSKQWQIYYYLLSISNYNSKSIENHRYVYKKNFSVSAAAKFLGISRPTIYTALSNLELSGLVISQEDYYLLYSKNWVKINNNTLKALLGFSAKASRKIDLLRVYLILKKLSEIAQTSEDMCFTKRDLVEILGHGTTHASEYEEVRYYLALLSHVQLIELKFHTDYKEGLGSYVVYHLQKVFDEPLNGDLEINIQAEQNSGAMKDYIKSEFCDFI